MLSEEEFVKYTTRLHIHEKLMVWKHERSLRERLEKTEAALELACNEIRASQKWGNDCADGINPPPFDIEKTDDIKKNLLKGDSQTY